VTTIAVPAWLPHEPEPQVAMHEHESAQSTSWHALLPAQVTVQDPSEQSTSSQALVPWQVIRHSASSRPQSTSPHAFVAMQLMTQDRASPQEIREHELPAVQLIVQSYPLGQSTVPLHIPGFVHWMAHVFVIGLQPPLHALGQSSFVQYPIAVSHTRPSSNPAQSASVLHSKSVVLLSTRQLAPTSSTKTAALRTISGVLTTNLPP